jgi:alcohol dehydrogenase (cytochrome c)
MFVGGGERAFENDSASGAVRAIDAVTAQVKWSFPLFAPPWAGVLSTAGGLVFGGSNEGNVFALDAATGQPLWKFQTGSPISSAPMAYLSDGKQVIVIASGHAVIAFGL